MVPTKLGQLNIRALMHRRKKLIEEICRNIELGLLDHCRGEYIYQRSVPWWQRYGPLRKRAFQKIRKVIHYAVYRQILTPDTPVVYAHPALFGATPSYLNYLH